MQVVCVRFVFRIKEAPYKSLPSSTFRDLSFQVTLNKIADHKKQSINSIDISWAAT